VNRTIDRFDWFYEHIGRGGACGQDSPGVCRFVAGTQTQNVPEGYNVDKFAVGRLQYDQIFSYGFE
jgi:hypothetical protein